MLEDVFERIPQSRFLRFLRMSQDLTGDADLGLHAGELVRVDDFDILGMLVRSSPSMRAAREHLAPHHEILESDFEILRRDGATVFRYLPRGAPSTPRILSEYFLAGATTLGSLLIGPIRPFELRFVHPRPEDAREHERIFQAPLRFDAGENAIVVGRDVMTRPMLQADAALLRVLCRHAERMLKTRPMPDDFPGRVRQLLAEELPRGRATIERIAAQMHQSERTLRRRLGESGTSYQALLENLRRELALSYVRESQLSVAEMSRSLGFSETGAFYRAFKRWTGVSVSEFRRSDSHE